MDNNNRRTGAKESSKTNVSKKAQNRKKSKMVIFGVEILVLVLLIGALWILRDFGINKANTQPDGSSGNGFLMQLDFNEADIAINKEVEDNEVMQGYRNIALFGVDSRSGALTKGTLSDAIIIASINLDTGDIKLVSVYRDTYLNLCRDTDNDPSNDKYWKCNSAYSNGGAEQAVRMLNMNLDMDIQDFVTVGFEGLTATIDALGGVYVDVDEEELRHINSYQETMAEDMHISYTPVTTTGYQLLNGLQATAYCRIRYKTGNDFARAASQREVIQAIADKAKKADLKTLVDVVDAVAPYVYTSFSKEEIIGLLGDIAKYSIVDQAGFPKDDMRGASTLGSAGSCVYPINLDDNVKWLHEYLFEEEDYQPSARVLEYSRVVHDFVSKYVNID
ncbi:MAG: LCP family protein [Lachnospiraceae bacterium]|nr:LCP family protein [Lachnospiraceae bacterium]